MVGGRSSHGKLLLRSLKVNEEQKGEAEQQTRKDEEGWSKLGKKGRGRA